MLNSCFIIDELDRRWMWRKELWLGYQLGQHCHRLLLSLVAYPKPSLIFFSKKRKCWSFYLMWNINNHCLLLGRITDNSETLWNLDAKPYGTIQVDIFSLDEENFPLKASKLLEEYYMPDVITFKVQTGRQQCWNMHSSSFWSDIIL